MGSSVEVWIDSVCSAARQYPPGTPPQSFAIEENKENFSQLPASDAAERKRKRRDGAVDMDARDDVEDTPRVRNKRQRQFTGTGSPAAPAPVRSEHSEDAASEVESHCSGRYSPIKQLESLKDAQEPIVFRSLDDPRYTPREDVIGMYDALDALVDEYAALGYDDATLQEVLASTQISLSRRDRKRFALQQREMNSSNGGREGGACYGSMPPVPQVAAIVSRAHATADQDEDAWNTEVHNRLLDLALSTSFATSRLRLFSVKYSKIEPPSLCGTNVALPRRIIDYTIALDVTQSRGFQRVWRSLTPLPGVLLKSWNHICSQTVREYPIAVHIETKAPTKSWTDGKPQIAIWVSAWFRRLERFQNSGGEFRQIPAIPVLIVQGHEWHLLIVQREAYRTVIWEKIDIGNTRSVYSACILLNVLHWLAHWADKIWRPWLSDFAGVREDSEDFLSIYHDYTTAQRSEAFVEQRTQL